MGPFNDLHLFEWAWLLSFAAWRVCSHPCWWRIHTEVRVLLILRGRWKWKSILLKRISCFNKSKDQHFLPVIRYLVFCNSGGQRSHYNDLENVCTVRRYGRMSPEAIMVFSLITFRRHLAERKHMNVHPGTRPLPMILPGEGPTPGHPKRL